MTFSSDQHPRDKAGRFINGASVQRLIASFPYAAATFANPSSPRKSASC